jgi:hypothetical protein
MATAERIADAVDPLEMPPSTHNGRAFRKSGGCSMSSGHSSLASQVSAPSS